MVLVIVEGQGQNSNWWVRAWSLSRWFTIRNSSSTLVIVVVISVVVAVVCLQLKIVVVVTVVVLVIVIGLVGVLAVLLL